MNANANMADQVRVKLDKFGIDRFVKTKSRRFVGAVMEAAKEELQGRDFEMKSRVTSTANTVTGSLVVSARNADILSEELGTETTTPAHTVGRLVRDPSVRSKIVRKAARSVE